MVTDPAIVPTRREARREARHDAIVEAAAASFLGHGYAATTMSAIAATLGGSKGTLWSYFASKEVLFGAVIDRATLDFRRQLQAILAPGDDLEATLLRFCREYLNKITSPDAIALHRLVVSESKRFPEVGRTFYERAPALVHTLLATYLAEEMDRGLLCRADPRVAARQLTALCQAGSHMLILIGQLDGATPERVGSDAGSAVATFLRAYAP
ncbi:MAG: TetR/AcrR family transcriptional regulator [Novosphingobium sp.]